MTHTNTNNDTHRNTNNGTYTMTRIMTHIHNNTPVEESCR